MKEMQIEKRCEIMAGSVAIFANIPRSQQDDMINVLLDASAEIERLREKLAYYTPMPFAPGNPEDASARLMCVRVRRSAESGAPEATVGPGQMAIAEVPCNVVVYSADARRLRRIVSAAEQIGAAWRDQQGVNGRLLDELAEATIAPMAPITEDAP